MQGLHGNLERLKHSPLLGEMRKNPGWQPLLFDEHGMEVPFPCISDKEPRGEFHRIVPTAVTSQSQGG